MTTTEKLLNELNDKKGLSYPDVGYSYFADIKGDGRNIRSVYTIINENGGVCYNRSLNGETPRKRCANIRQAMIDVRHPIKFKDGETDHRYKICKQFTGRENISFVAMFCDEWIKPQSYDTYAQALKVVNTYHNERGIA